MIAPETNMEMIRNFLMGNPFILMLAVFFGIPIFAAILSQTTMEVMDKVVYSIWGKQAKEAATKHFEKIGARNESNTTHSNTTGANTAKRGNSNNKPEQ